MKRLFLVCASLALLIPAPFVLAAGTVLAPGDAAPEMWGRDSSGQVIRVDYSQAKITLLNFCATWCEPCRNELPMLQRAHSTLGPEGLQIVGVTYEALENEELSAFTEEFGLTYPLIFPARQVRDRWVGVRGTLPNSYLIGPDGRVMRRYVGATPEQIAAMEADLTAALEGRRLATMIFPSQPAVATSADRSAAQKAAAKKE